MIGAALKQGSVTKQPVIVNVNVIVFKEGLGWLRKKALVELFSRDFEPLDRGGPKAG